MPDGESRYYWLKLKRDFFKRHDIRIIENMPNGKDYILFYLKLLCESVDHDGNLRFSEQIPYNEDMLATITNTNVDTVRSAINVFSQLNMMEVMDDGTFFMNEVCKMIGSAANNDNANRQRRFRERQKSALLEERYGCVTKNNESKSKSIDSELDTEKDIYKLSNSKELVCQTQNVRLVVDKWNELSKYGIKSLYRMDAESKRYQNLVARLKQYDVDKVLEAIAQIEKSKFLQGENNRGWRITFEWFVLPNNFPKVLEGQYENRQKNDSLGGW